MHAAGLVRFARAHLAPGCHRFDQTRWLSVYVFCEVLGALGVSVWIHSVTAVYALDALLFFPVFAVCLAHWRIGRLVLLTSLWGATKSLALILAVWACGDYVGELVSCGSAYHADTLSWILVNDGPNAHPEVFAWCHLEGLGRVIVSSIASFGMTTLVAGSRELNVMNFHVASLLRDAEHPLRILVFGWPPWSLLRGWAYLFVMIGTAPLFLSIVRRTRPPWRQLVPYFCAGVALAGVDLGLKVLFAPCWRQLLLAAYQ
jgi:hypothetical protein